MKSKAVRFIENYGNHKKGEVEICEMKLAGLLSEKGIVKILRNKKCYVCQNEKIQRVFTNKRRVNHFYCKRCADKYLIKFPKLKHQGETNGK